MKFNTGFTADKNISFQESTASPGGRGGNDQVGSDGSNSNRASSKPMTEINNTDMPKKVMADRKLYHLSSLTWFT